MRSTTTMTLFDDSFRTWQGVWGVVILAVAAVAATRPRPLATLELVFLLWFVGFLGGVEILSPRHENPERWTKLRWIVLVGLTVSTAIVVRRAIVVW